MKRGLSGKDVMLPQWRPQWANQRRRRMMLRSHVDDDNDEFSILSALSAEPAVSPVPAHGQVDDDDGEVSILSAPSAQPTVMPVLAHGHVDDDGEVLILSAPSAEPAVMPVLAHTHILTHLEAMETRRVQMSSLAYGHVFFAYVPLLFTAIL
jgi:hypothetical protein